MTELARVEAQLALSLAKDSAAQDAARNAAVRRAKGAGPVGPQGPQLSRKKEKK